jgi:hypothetical protein
LVTAGAPAALFKVAFIVFATLIGTKMLFGSGRQIFTSLPGNSASFSAFLAYPAGTVWRRRLAFGNSAAAFAQRRRLPERSKA